MLAGSGGGPATSVGSGAPTATNPADAKGGDLYVDKDTGDIYTYNATTNEWEKAETLTSIKINTNDNGTPMDTSDDYKEIDEDEMMRPN